MKKPIVVFCKFFSISSVVVLNVYECLCPGKYTAYLKAHNIIRIASDVTMTSEIQNPCETGNIAEGAASVFLLLL